MSTIKSSQARSKINQWFRKEFKEENIIRGKELIEKYTKNKGITLSDITKPELTQIVQQKKYGFKDWDAVCAAIGHGGLKEGQIVNRLHEEYKKKKYEKNIAKPADDIIKEVVDTSLEPAKKKQSKSGIMVKGVEDLAVRFSKCCNPVPGDEIVGFITRGRGVSVHRTDCTNVINLSEIERHRLIEAEWQNLGEKQTNRLYQVEIQIIGSNKVGLLVDVSKVLTEEKKYP